MFCGYLRKAVVFGKLAESFVTLDFCSCNIITCHLIPESECILLEVDRIIVFFKEDAAHAFKRSPVFNIAANLVSSACGYWTGALLEEPILSVVFPVLHRLIVRHRFTPEEGRAFHRQGSS